MSYDAFYPGRVWLDTDGKRIQAHGGSLMVLNGVYYWYGENKEKTDGKNGIWHWGVRCYSGYVLPTSGEKKDIIIFSVMTNNVTAPTSKVLQVMDKIIALVASGN